MAYEDEDSIGLLDETEEESRKRAGLTGGVYDSGHPRVPAKSITHKPDYQTSLSPEDEQKFQSWTKESKAPWQDSPTSDYDMRGYWKAQQSGDPNAHQAANQHYPDTWKTPNHKTFSDESIYATPGAPHWEGGQLAPTLPKSILGPSESMQPATSITAGPLDSAKQPSAPLGPAGQREHDLLAQGAPQYHGAKKVLDILGRATAPGRMIEQGTGLGTLGYESRLGQASTDAAHEQAQSKAPLDLEYERAKTGAQQGLERQENARATALEHPPVKQKEEEWGVVPNVQGPNGEPVQQEKTSGQIRLAPLPGATVTEKKQPPEHQNDFEQYYSKWINDNKKPDTAANRLQAHKEWETQGGKEPAGSWMPLYDEKGNVTGAWNATNGQVRHTPSSMPPGKTAPGAHIASAAEAATQKAVKPYQDMVSSADEAKTLADMAEKGNAEADVDLALMFFKMMRGQNSGVRFTQQENNLIMHARGLGQDMVGIGQKVLGGGQPFTPEQRKNVVAVIQMHAEVAQKALDRLQQGGGEGGGGAAQPPREPKAGMKWQQNKKTGEYREVPVA